MANPKIAISLKQSLYREINQAAVDLNLSRSSLLSLAAEEFLRRRRNRQLLVEINAAYADAPDEEELQLVTAYKEKMQKVADTWQ